MRSASISLVCSTTLALALPAAAQTVANSFDVQPLGIAFVGGVGYDSTSDHVWVADSTSDLISEYNRTGTLIQQIIPVSTNVIGVAVDPASNSLWIADENEMVYEYDRITGLPTGVFWTVTPTIVDLSSAAFDSDTGTLWFGQDSGTPTAAEFDTAGTLLRSIDLTGTGAIDPDGLAFNTVTDTLFLGEDTGDRVLEVDLAGNLLNQWTVTDPIYGIISPEGLGIDTANGKLYIGDGFVHRRVFEVDGIVGIAPSGPTLAVGGICPGAQTANASGMTPAGPVAFYYAIAAGSTTLPSGGCAGLNLPVTTPTQLGGFAIADTAGNVSVPGASQPNHCGLVILGAVDIATCTGTNTITL